jgi:ADP-ribosylglycohydrolase
MNITHYQFNEDHLRSKVAGCWLGKNIGGTLGAPFERTHDHLDLSFYSQELNGEPEPNDDLDLQLVWLEAIERVGLGTITPRVLGEFWLDFVTAGWNEYGVCSANLQNGFFPPLSGSIKNERWKDSNGAWIRSEIWACIFPGNPEYACRYAWMDAAADHSGDGIFAELFTTALQSMAFVQSDIRTLITDALAMIPADSRIAQSVRQVCDAFDQGKDWLETRNDVVDSHQDAGWFQASQNIAFLIIGLLYGRGDFDRTLCHAVNCGDDTDCTAATAGAVMGIILGADAIPEKWTRPIGNGIRTVSIDIMHNNIEIPKTLDALTERTIAQTKAAHRMDPRLPEIATFSDLPTHDFSGGFAPVSEQYTQDILEADTLWMSYPLSSGEMVIAYPDGVEISAGGELRVVLNSNAHNICRMDTCSIRLRPPEGWSVNPGPEITIRKSPGAVEIVLQADVVTHAVTYIPAEIRTRGRNYPEMFCIPVQTKGAVQPNMCGDYKLGLRREQLKFRRANLSQTGNR